MIELRDQVARAQRRLVLEQFLAHSVWCLFAGLGIAAVAIALPRIVPLNNLAQHWDAMWLVAAIVGGLVAAGAWTIATRRTTLDAAIEIDRRFALRERIASSLSLSDAERHTQVGQALEKDAIRVASRIDIGDRFRVRVSRRAWLPLVPATMAFLLMIFLTPTSATSSLDPNSPTAIAKQLNTAAKTARKKLMDEQQRAERSGLKSAEGLFQRIEAGLQELAEKQDLDRTEAAVQLNNLAKQLAERRQQLGGKESVQKQLQNLKGLGQGTAGKIAQAMKQGDFQQAAEEADKIAHELRDDKLDSDTKDALAKQLDAMNEKLSAAADAHDQAQNDLKQQIEQQRRSGDMTQAGRSQQKLDELAAKSPSMDKLRELASQMGKSQSDLQQSNNQQAADAMQQMAQQLGAMEQAAGEQKMIDSALDHLQSAKESMNSPNGQVADAQESEIGAGKQAKSDSRHSDKPGHGIGTGSEARTANENLTEFGTQKLQVQQSPGRGNAVFAGKVAGPNFKGQVEAAIQEQVTSFGDSATDPFSTDRLPRNRREHAEEYFNMLREGK